jgi:hypothetical protein
MNTALTHRRALGERIAAAYAERPNAAAVILAGSVGRGTADAFSDIEIDVFWKSTPSEEDFLTPIATVGGDLLYRASDENEWADGFFIEGIKVDTSQFLVSTTERWLHEVVDNADTEVEKQLLIAAIQHAIPLHGDELVERWRTHAAHYPDALVHATLEEHLRFRARFMLTMFAERNDTLLLYHGLVDETQLLMKVLMGLNRLYIPHPYFKWMDWQIGQMQIAPPNLAARLRHVLRDEPQAAVGLMHQLIEETFDLIDQHTSFDTQAARAEFNGKRSQEPNTVPAQGAQDAK